MLRRMRQLRSIIGVTLALCGCGPEVASDDLAGDSGSTSTQGPGGTSESSVDGSGSSSTSHDPDSAGNSSAAGSESVGVDPMHVADWVHTQVTCNEDGSMDILLEAMLETDVKGCGPPAELTPDNMLLISLVQWKGGPGTVTLTGVLGESATAGLGEELLRGTITLEVSEPTQPLALEIDLEGETQVITGVIDLSECLFSQAPCPVTPD